MPFSYDMPDPEILPLDRTVGPDGVTVVSAAPELGALLDDTIEAQNGALRAVIRPMSDAVQAHLTAQAQGNGAAAKAAMQAAQRQIDGQRAALDVVTQRMADGVSDQLARQGEQVNTVAIAAAMQPPKTNPPITTSPAPPRLPTGPTQPMPIIKPPSLITQPTTPTYYPFVPPPGVGGATTCPPATHPVSVYDPLNPDKPQTGCVQDSIPGAPPPPAAPGGADPGCQPGWHRICDYNVNDPTTWYCCAPDEPPAVGVGGEEVAVEEPVDGGIEIIPAPPVEVLPPPADETPEELPPPEDETPVPFEPPGICPWKITQQIPPIGGPEWCLLQPQITASLAELGNAAFNLVIGWLPNSACYDIDTKRASLVCAPLAEGVSPILKWLRKQVKDASDPAVNSVIQVVDCWRQLTQLSPTCNPSTMLGLTVARAVIKALKHWRVGINLGIVATLDLALDLPAIERAINYIIEAQCPSKIPGADAAWSAFRAGFIDEQTMRCWSLAEGRDPDLWAPVKAAGGHALSPDQVMLFSRLVGNGDAAADVALQQRGWSRDADRLALIQLYDRPASPQMMLSWTVDGVLDADVEGILHRSEGFSDAWAGEPGRIARAHGVTEEVYANQWVAAQPLPTLGEMREWLYRLRPGLASPDDAWDVERTEALLRAGHTPPGVIGRVLATIYQRLSVGDAMGLIRLGVSDDGQAERALLDAGYAPDDASRLVKVVLAEAYRSYYAQTHGWTLALAVDAIRSGTQLPPDAVQALDLQGYTAAQLQTAVEVDAVTEFSHAARRGRMLAKRRAIKATIDAYSAGLIDATTAQASLVASGEDAASASAQVQSTDLELQTQRTEEAIKHVGRGLLSGEISKLQAAQILGTAGIDPVRIAQLSAAWAIEQAASRPMAAVGQIRTWVSQGLLTLDAGRQRLANLGWRDPDLTLMVSEMGAALAKAQASAEKKGATAAAAAAKAADRVRQQALRRLERSQPVSAIGQWYKDGSIGRQEVIDRMTQYGYDKESIDLYLSGWDYQLSKRTRSATGVKPQQPLTPQRQVPIGRLRAWYLDGIVDQSYVRERLNGYGYDADVVDGIVAQWNLQAEARAGRKTEPPPL